MASGFPYIVDAQGQRVHRVQVGDVLTGTIGSYEDENGMKAGTVRVNWWWGQANLIAAGTFGNQGITAEYTVQPEDVGRHLYVTYQYTVDDGGSTVLQPFSGSVAVEVAEPALPAPTFRRLTRQDITDAGSQGKVFNFADSGDYLYAAANRDSCYIWNISDPANPVYVRKVQLYDPAGDPSSLNITDVKVFPVNGVDHLFLCGRNIDYSAGNETGIFACYGLTDPSNPNWRSSYRPPDMDPKPFFSGLGYANNWYQGMSYNPDQANVVNVASQVDGHTAMDVSDPDAVTPLAVYGEAELAVSRPSGPIWECSNCASFTDVNGEQWVVYPNHGFGVYLVNVTTPATPTDIIWLRGFQPFRLNGTDDVNQNRIQCRHRMVHMVGYHALFCFNTAGGTGADDRPARGLLSIDLSDPYLVADEDDATDAFTWSPIGIEDNDTWNEAGDQPQLGFTVDPNGLYAYVANGTKGTAVFDIKDPGTPRYLGLQGTDLHPQTNLYQSYAIERDGVRYQYYSDAYDAAPQQNFLYVDEVRGMAFTIGNRDTSSTSGTITAQNAYASDAVANSYTASQGDRVNYLGIRAEAHATIERSMILAVYTVSGGNPDAKVAGTEVTITIPAGGGWDNYENATPLEVSLTDGVEYITAFCGDNAASQVTVANGGGLAASRDNSGSNVLPDSWTDSAATADWAVYATGESSYGLLTTSKASGLVVGKS